MSQIPEHLAPPLLPAKLPLLRPKQGRVIAGVARGISMHLGVSVALVRIVFVLLACWFGVGALAYVALWIAIPEGNPVAEAARLRGTHSSRNAPLARGNASVGESESPLFVSQTLDSAQDAWYAYTGLEQSTDSPSAKDSVRRTLANASKPAIFAGIGVVLIALPSGLNAVMRFSGSQMLPIVPCLAGMGLPWLNTRAQRAGMADAGGRRPYFHRIPRVRGTDGRQEWRRAVRFGDRLRIRVAGGGNLRADSAADDADSQYMAGTRAQRA